MNHVNKTFGHKVRTRVCGIVVKEDKILMVRHEPLGPLGYLWSPPGGAIEYGRNLEVNLKRELREETGIEVEVGDFMFLNEYLNPPMHAVELFFRIDKFDGEIIKGTDPELLDSEQMIKEVAFMSFDMLKKMKPIAVHNIFRKCSSIDDLLALKGFFKFENNSTI